MMIKPKPVEGKAVPQHPKQQKQVIVENNPAIIPAKLILNLSNPFSAFASSNAYFTVGITKQHEIGSHA